MSGTCIIAGVSGDARNRLEINTFVQNDKFFSLYIQALQLMYTKESQDATRSFFQIGGIHGLPYVSWDNAGDPTDSGWKGYCMHKSILFPTWHRPHLVLFEQVMQQHAKEIAATYITPDKAEWVMAAADIRQPYWDWAAKSVPPDRVIELREVTITGPDGRKILVANPLFHYTFHPIDDSFCPPYSSWKSTIRQPTSEGPDATDNTDHLKEVLRKAQKHIRSSTYNMLTQVHNWHAFSNTGVGNDNSFSNSIEGVHNGIHVDVGGEGHMSDPAYAGFDPIFFLHHCNVDRMLSLWSALNPRVWVGSKPPVGLDENTPLKPFWDKPTSFWPSRTLYVTKDLGYTYPEFDGLHGSDEGRVQAAIRTIVNRLYGDPLYTATDPIHQPYNGLAPPNIGLYDWTVRIEFKKYELGCSFAVRVFLGDVPEDLKEWPVSDRFVGAHQAFVNSQAERCSNCQDQHDSAEEGFVHLNWAIVARSGLGSLDPEVVEPYLTKELHWRVQKMDGSEAQLDSLEVSVYVIPLSYPPGTVFPVHGEGRRVDGITRGRKGGA